MGWVGIIQASYMVGSIKRGTQYRRQNRIGAFEFLRVSKFLISAAGCRVSGQGLGVGYKA